MSEVIFAHPRHHYDSYTDYKRLVELSCFPTCYVDEIDPASDNVYIISPYNEEWAAGWQSPRARIILWDIEWHIENFPHVPGVREVWASDKWYAQQIGAKYVPMGSHRKLAIADFPNADRAGEGFGVNMPALYNDREFVYDIALLAYLTNRRQRLILGGDMSVNNHTEYMKGTQEYDLKLAPNGWGLRRHEALTTTRLMIHCHQHDHVATIAPQRLALAAAYMLPVLCETVEDWGIFSLSYLLRSDYLRLSHQAHMWAQDKHREMLGDYAYSLHSLLCEQHTFRREVENAL